MRKTRLRVRVRIEDDLRYSRLLPSVNYCPVSSYTCTTLILDIEFIDLDQNGKKFSIDARPSDAIALAVRSHVPIFVSEVVMMQAKLVNAEKDAEETKKFKDFIDNMRPEDFTKYYQKD